MKIKIILFFFFTILLGCKSYYTPKTNTSFEYVVFEPRVNKLNEYPKIKRLVIKNHEIFSNSKECDSMIKHDFLNPFYKKFTDHNVKVLKPNENLKLGYNSKNRKLYFEALSKSVDFLTESDEFVIIPVTSNLCYSINSRYDLIGINFEIVKNNEIVFSQYFGVYYQHKTKKIHFTEKQADLIIRKLLNNIGYEN